MCSDVPYSSFWESAASWDAAQATAEVLLCLKQGCTVWLILGTAQALLRVEAQRRGSHRSHTGDRYCGGAHVGLGVALLGPWDSWFNHHNFFL